MTKDELSKGLETKLFKLIKDNEPIQFGDDRILDAIFEYFQEHEKEIQELHHLPNNNNTDA